MPVETRRRKRLRLEEEQQHDIAYHHPKKQKRNQKKVRVAPEKPRVDHISTLPNEVLSLIFETTYQLSSDTLGEPTLVSLSLAVRLSHVSRRFRAISLGTPLLWLAVSDAQPSAAVRAFVQRSASTKAQLKLILFCHIKSHDEDHDKGLWNAHKNQFANEYAQAVQDFRRHCGPNKDENSRNIVFRCCPDCAWASVMPSPDILSEDNHADSHHDKLSWGFTLGFANIICMLETLIKNCTAPRQEHTCAPAKKEHVL
ncbi:hypothetical protein DFH11DRAFT_913186 [Phellopilus nigrolimitatus]|nr:hypothetical protein DFH11DRAFT_913186 [Phellopilus nigrolimitatus]